MGLFSRLVKKGSSSSLTESAQQERRSLQALCPAYGASLRTQATKDVPQGKVIPSNSSLSDENGIHLHHHRET